MVIDLIRQFLTGLRVLAASTLALGRVAVLAATSRPRTHRRGRVHPTTREATHPERSDIGASTIEVVILILGLMGIAAVLVAALYAVVHSYIAKLK